eukprot:gene36962-60176_t
MSGVAPGGMCDRSHAHRPGPGASQRNSMTIPSSRHVPDDVFALPCRRENVTSCDESEVDDPGRNPGSGEFVQVRDAFDAVPVLVELGRADETHPRVQVLCGDHDRQGVDPEPWHAEAARLVDAPLHHRPADAGALYRRIDTEVAEARRVG